MIIWDHSLQPDHLRSSLIISDQTWPTGDHHIRNWRNQSPSSPIIPLLYHYFSSNFVSSEVGHLAYFVIFQFYQEVFITAVKDCGFWSVSSGTSSNSCEKSLFFHPQTLISSLIIHWGAHGHFSTNVQRRVSPCCRFLLPVAAFIYYLLLPAAVLLFLPAWLLSSAVLLLVTFYYLLSTFYHWVTVAVALCCCLLLHLGYFYYCCCSFFSSSGLLLVFFLIQYPCCCCISTAFCDLFYWYLFSTAGF